MVRPVVLVCVALLAGACSRSPGVSADTTTTSTTAAPTTTTTVLATYTVQAGDTLAAIAERFDTTVAALVTANDLADPNVLAVGQVLELPSAAP